MGRRGAELPTPLCLRSSASSSYLYLALVSVPGSVSPGAPAAVFVSPSSPGSPCSFSASEWAAPPCPDPEVAQPPVPDLESGPAPPREGGEREEGATTIAQHSTEGRLNPGDIWEVKAVTRKESSAVEPMHVHDNQPYPGLDFHQGRRRVGVKHPAKAWIFTEAGAEQCFAGTARLRGVEPVVLSAPTLNSGNSDGPNLVSNANLKAEDAHGRHERSRTTPVSSTLAHATPVPRVSHGLPRRRATHGSGLLPWRSGTNGARWSGT